MNWNTNVMSSQVTGSLLPVTSVMPTGNNILTWAFATGSCDAESWAGLTAAQVATNVPLFVAAGKKYIISTGGAAGAFSCNSDTGFTAFVNRYNSANLVGIDFDIEAGQSSTDIANLVARVKVALLTFPTLRFSFTVATLAGSGSGNMLGATGTVVLQAIKSSGLAYSPRVLINLMTMDYGSTTSTNCAIGSNGRCDMGASAVAASESIHNYWNVPYSSIEVTPMIGGNDAIDEIFTIADVATLSSYAKSKGLGGVHTWSLDRDKDCPTGYASPTCNTYGQAGTLGFTKAFVSKLA